MGALVAGLVHGNSQQSVMDDLHFFSSKWMVANGTSAQISEQQVGKSELKSQQQIGQCHQIPTKNGWNGWSVGYLHDNNDTNGTSPWQKHWAIRTTVSGTKRAKVLMPRARRQNLQDMAVSPNPHGLEVGLFFQKYLEKCDDLGQTAYWEISIVWDRGIEKGSGIGDLRRISSTMPQSET